MYFDANSPDFLLHKIKNGNMNVKILFLNIQMIMMLSYVMSEHITNMLPADWLYNTTRIDNDDAFPL